LALFDNIPGWKVFSTGIGIAGLAVVGYFIWVWFFAVPDDLKPLQRQAADHALDLLAEEYAAKVRFEGPQNVVVMAVHGDTTNNQIREMLMRRLNRLEGVSADVPRSPTLEQRAGALVRGLIRDRGEADPDPSAVFEDAGEADEVLTLSVTRNWSGADSGIFEIEVYRIARDDTPERTPVVLDMQRIRGLSGTARTDDTPLVAAGPGFWSHLWAWLWRAAVVLVVTAALPFLTWPGLRVAFRQDSNALNGGLLMLLTAVDVLLVFVLVGFAFTTAAVISAAILLPVALLYNFRILNVLETQA
jgi:hypothetical protein